MGEPRPKLNVMSLTDASAERVRVILEKAERPAVGLRVGITKGGCAGMTYKVEYAENVKPGDEVIEDKGVRVIVDPSAVLFLLGTEMDYKVDKLSAQFVFKNPNETSACGCGESVQLTPASEAEASAS
jgi:iron-sulfur cluster assembly protein